MAIDVQKIVDRANERLRSMMPNPPQIGAHHESPQTRCLVDALVTEVQHEIASVEQTIVLLSAKLKNEVARLERLLEDRQV